MEKEPQLRERIFGLIADKANLKQEIYENTECVFNELKEVLNQMSTELNDELDERLDKHVRIEYRDRGKYEAQLQIAGDVLIFSMHSNVFEFNREHLIWNNPYVLKNRANSYCGVINIYNFLADSLRYNRNSDEGYLIGRIFINREKHFFVEGKRQICKWFGKFESQVIDRQALISIVERALEYTINFDLLVPPFEIAKIVTLDQLNTKVEHPRIKTGKRLGYRYNASDGSTE